MKESLWGILKREDTLNIPPDYEVDVGAGKLQQNELAWDEWLALTSVIEVLDIEEKGEDKKRKNMIS